MELNRFDSVPNEIKGLIASQNPDAAKFIMNEYTNEKGEIDPFFYRIYRKQLPIAHNDLEAEIFLLSKQEFILADNVMTLNLNGIGLKELPDWFSFITLKPNGKQTQLEYLNLDNNELTSLPASFGSTHSFTQLRYLFLSDNKLTSLPASFGSPSSFPQLQILFLDKNQKILARQRPRFANFF